MGCMLVDFWTKMETISTASFTSVLHKLSCLFNEKAHVATNSSFCANSQPHFIALYVLVTSGMTCTSYIIIYSSICKYISRISCSLSTVIFFLSCALTLTMVQCWTINL